MEGNKENEKADRISLFPNMQTLRGVFRPCKASIWSVLLKIVNGF